MENLISLTTIWDDEYLMTEADFASRLSKLEIWDLDMEKELASAVQNVDIKHFPVLTGLTRGGKMTKIYKELTQLPRVNINDRYVMAVASLTDEDDWSRITFFHVGPKHVMVGGL